MFRLNKGLDRPPEVMGIKGMNYLQYLAGGVVGGLLVVTALIGIGLNAVVCFGLFLAGAVVLFQWLSRMSRQYGERGYARITAGKALPVSVMFRSSKCFKMLIPTKGEKALLPPKL